jgi:hypothetical protein
LKAAEIPPSVIVIAKSTKTSSLEQSVGGKTGILKFQPYSAWGEQPKM